VTFAEIKSGEPADFCVVRNISKDPLPLDGWSVWERNDYLKAKGNRCPFPKGTKLAPKQLLFIWFLKAGDVQPDLPRGYADESNPPVVHTCKCFGIKRGENICIVNDEERTQIAKSIP
jgi:hypothetical protein